jgi:hypothetical protein
MHSQVAPPIAADGAFRSLTKTSKVEIRVAVATWEIGFAADRIGKSFRQIDARLLRADANDDDRTLPAGIRRFGRGFAAPPELAEIECPDRDIPLYGGGKPACCRGSTAFRAFGLLGTLPLL